MKKKAFGVLTQSGFSLVEVMVAAGLMGVVALGTAQLLTNLNRGQNKAVQNYNVIELMTEIRYHLGSEEGCRQTLVVPGIRVPNGAGSNAIPTIRNRTNNVVFTPIAPNNQYGGGMGRATRILIVSFSLTSYAGQTNQANTARTAYVRVNYRKFDSATNNWAPPPPAAPFSKDIPIVVVPTLTGVNSPINRCYVEDLSETACVALGGMFINGTNRCSTIDLALNSNSSLNLGTNGRICRDGVCDSTFGTNQVCPLTGIGMDARCINMVGISAGGRIMCGAAPGTGVNCNP